MCIRDRGEHAAKWFVKSRFFWENDARYAHAGFGHGRCFVSGRVLFVLPFMLAEILSPRAARSSGESVA